MSTCIHMPAYVSNRFHGRTDQGGVNGDGTDSDKGRRTTPTPPGTFVEPSAFLNTVLAFVELPFRMRKKAPGLRRISSWLVGVVVGPSSSLPGRPIPRPDAFARYGLSVDFYLPRTTSWFQRFRRNCFRFFHARIFREAVQVRSPARSDHGVTATGCHQMAGHPMTKKSAV